jgi:hypothetical protein
MDFLKSMALAAMGVSLIAGGCNSSDPSAQEELNRLKAEKAAAESSLAKKDGEIASLKGLHEAEMAGLKGQLETVSKQLEDAKSVVRMPSPEQMEQKLSMETMKLRHAAEQQLKGYVMKEFRLHDINIPSPESPCQARVTMTMVSPNGETGQLFWQGQGDMSGNWHYEAVDGFNSGPGPKPTPPKPGPTPPAPTPTPKPTPPKPPVVDPHGAMHFDNTYTLDLSKLHPLDMPKQ